jgi:hypothetical protein
MRGSVLLVPFDAAAALQVEGQTRGFKGASRAYRKIGECGQVPVAVPWRLFCERINASCNLNPPTTRAIAGEAECGLECDDVFMSTMQKQVKRRTFPPAENRTVSRHFPRCSSCSDACATECKR